MPSTIIPELFEIDPGTAAPEDVGVYVQLKVDGKNLGDPFGPYPSEASALAAVPLLIKQAA
jgi:hypothetical protein